MERRPNPPAEAVLLRLTREAAQIKASAAATQAGLSPARWSQIENGFEKRLGQYRKVRARAGTLAHMAHIVGVSPDRLEAAGRPDAADILREILRQSGETPQEPERTVEPAPDPLDSLTPRERELAKAFVQAIRAAADTPDAATRRDVGN